MGCSQPDWAELDSLHTASHTTKSTCITVTGANEGVFVSKFQDHIFYLCRVFDEDDGIDQTDARSRRQPPSNHIGQAIHKYGLPSGDFIMRYSNHVLQYDTVKKIPKWVLQHISKEDLKGNADRDNCKFRPDQSIPRQFQSHNGDYLGSGFARGHMVPASKCSLIVVIIVVA